MTRRRKQPQVKAESTINSEILSPGIVDNNLNTKRRNEVQYKEYILEDEAAAALSKLMYDFGDLRKKVRLIKKAFLNEKNTIQSQIAQQQSDIHNLKQFITSLTDTLNKVETENNQLKIQIGFLGQYFMQENLNQYQQTYIPDTYNNSNQIKQESGIEEQIKKENIKQETWLNFTNFEENTGHCK